MSVFKCKRRHVIECSPRCDQTKIFVINHHRFLSNCFVYRRIWHDINKILTLFLSHADRKLIFNQQKMLLNLPKFSLQLAQAP